MDVLHKQGKNFWKNVLRFIFFLIPIVIFYFLIRNIARDWNELRSYAINANYWIVFLSLLIFTLANLFVIWIWTSILRKFSVTFDFPTVFAIWTVSTLGKYIPGKGWQFLSIMLLGEKLGIGLEVVGTTSILAQLLMIIAGLFIAFPIVIDYLNSPVFGVFVILLFLLLYPPILNKILLYVSRKTGRKVVRIEMGIWQILLFTLLYAASWFLYGVAFSLLVKSVGLSQGVFSLFLTRVYISSYLLGLFAIFVPGGLGVREGVMAVLLSQIMDANVASFISVAARIVVTLSELSLTLIGFCILRKKKLLVFGR